jgi:hypothetical protein
MEIRLGRTAHSLRDRDQIFAKDFVHQVKAMASK